MDIILSLTLNSALFGANQIMWAIHYVLVLYLAGFSGSWLQNPALQKSADISGRTQSTATKAKELKAKASADPAPSVDATQVVITVRGVCDQSSSPKAQSGSDSCVTVIRREQFEMLVKALNPTGHTLSAEARRGLARTYADYLAVEAAARKAGMEDTSEFRTVMEWNRLRAIADLYRFSLEEKYRSPADAEVEAYYRQHLGDYEKMTLARILVPRQNAAEADKDAFDKKARGVADAAQSRAVKGDDPAQIQKDAYAALGVAVAPSTELGSRRRSELVPEEATELFSLKGGEVSHVEKEAQNYVIYKVLRRDVMPLAEVRAEVAREIYKQKFKDTMKSALDAVPAEFNEQYFGSKMAPQGDQAAPVAGSR
ncbi:MAG TPA: peptidyl-prolyl cis-trans isomerase [Candidatus Angelobacter sp.]|nr:peptidyl-prolyl cis-trans isomerase [Candidatus Angelobacter sp.]